MQGDRTGHGPHTGQVRRRRVFYIPGYDPIHPRRYRELYRTEAASQAEICGYDIALTARQGKGPFGWHVRSRIDGCEVETEVEVLVWSDIVRDSMSGSIPATYSQLLRTAWIYITTGTLWRLMRLRKGPVIAALYPVVMLLGQLALALLLAWGVARAGGVIGSHMATGLTARAITLLGIGLGLGAGYALLRWFKQRDGKFFAYYLMHDYSYSARSYGENSAELEARMAEFQDRIAKALKQPDLDEVLVVGHSSGAHVGVSVLADLIRTGHAADGPDLGFLSLGQVVPMVSFLPRAFRLRADLQYLSTRTELIWVDVSAPGDGCAFALCDPVAVSGVASTGKIWPLVFSAAFTQSLTPARWKALRWRFFRLHFQYLCAFDHPGSYDYFQITAGPRTLRDRYDGRAQSRSRIARSVSKFTSVAAR